MYGTDGGETAPSRPTPSPAAARPWSSSCDRMRFMSRVEVEDATAELAVAWRPRRAPASRTTATSSCPRERLTAYAEAAGPACGLLGVRGAAHRPRRAAARARHRPPHDPQRGRLDRPRRAPRQGLLPRPGDGRPGAHPRPAAAPADAAAPRRLREPAARASAASCCWARRSSASSAPRPGTTSSARSRWRWSSATCRSTPQLDADGMPAAQEVVVDPEVGLHVRPMLRG